MLKFSSFLSEGMTGLRPGELSKPNSKTKEPRIDILKHAVINGITLPLTDNSEVVFANTPENITAIDNFDGKTALNLTTIDGKTITSSRIGKSAIFGGGSGAGGGTDNTAQTESGQCLWLAAMLEYGNQPIEFFTPSILKKAMKRIDVGKTSFDEMISMDSAWQVSAYLSAQKIIKAGYANKKHKFHRDSKEMNYIYKTAKKEAFKNSGITALTDDKWNPGDIWAIEDGINLKKELDTSSIGALNTSIVRLFKERKVVGISLKLVKKDAKAKEYNVEGSPQTQKFTSAAVKTNRGTFFSNKGGTVEFTGGSMEIRPNNYLGANKIEITGKTARGGGAGWGVIMAAAKRYMGVNIPKHGTIKTVAQKMAKGDKRSLQYFYKMAKTADASLTYDYFLEEAPKKDAGWFSAKLAAVMIVHYLNNNKGRKADAFINAIVNYAASSSDDSSAFVKIYQ